MARRIVDDVFLNEETQKVKNEINTNIENKANEVLETVKLTVGSTHSKADFEAKAELVRRLCAGSGFVEWGKHYNVSGININEGLWMGDITSYTRENTLYIGKNAGSYQGNSRTGYPIVNVNGYLIRLSYINHTYDFGRIKFPEPPSSPDHLYRQDLVFLEVWHEDVSEKDVVFPYGNVQYGADTYTAPDGTVFHTTPITDLGIKQGYSAFGSWDKETVGKGIRWSSLTDEQKKAFMSDPWNNIYVDGDKVIQVRYRVRVAQGKGDGLWHGLDCSGNTANLISTQGGDYYRLMPQGKRDIPAFGNDTVHTYATSIEGSFETKYNESDAVGYFGTYGTWNVDVSVQGSKKYYAILIALVARRNTGAFHPVYNPNGSALFAGSKRFWEVTPTAPSFNIVGVDKDNKQFKVAGDKTSDIKAEYFIEVTGSTGNDGRYWVTKVEYDSDNDQTIITVANSIPSNTADGKLTSDFGYVKYCFDNADGGTVESGKSGRPDGKYADEINEGDVKDLRNYALRVTDYQRLLEKEFNKLLLGEMRGWQGIPCLMEGYIRDDGYPKHWLIVQPNAQEGRRQQSRRIFRPDLDDSTRGRGRFIYNKSKDNGVIFGENIIAENNYGAIRAPTWEQTTYFDYDNIVIFNAEHSKIFFRRYLHCDFVGTLDKIKTIKYQHLGWYNLWGDYGESFIPTDDFTATVDSSDTHVIKISGDKRYAIKKNCRLFVRNTSNVSIGVFRVKSVSFDGTNTVVKLTGSAGSGGSTVRVSTCIASGRNGKTSASSQVYIFKLSRRPLNPNNIRVLIRKKDGTWYAYNNFEPVSVYNSSSSIQDFIDDVGGLDKEVKFNERLNWIGVNISDIYSALGYSNEDDFKQNAVIEVYYETKANPLRLSTGDWWRVLLATDSYIHFRMNDADYSKYPEWLIGKAVENAYTSYYKISNASDIEEQPLRYINVYYRRTQYIKADLPTNLDLNYAKLGFAVLPVLAHKNTGKIYFVAFYNEVLQDFDTHTIGWEGALYVSNYESVTTDANGNNVIAGQKYVELPYFVWNEDKDK